MGEKVVITEKNPWYICAECRTLAMKNNGTSAVKVLGNKGFVYVTNGNKNRENILHAYVKPLYTCVRLLGKNLSR